MNSYELRSKIPQRKALLREISLSFTKKARTLRSEFVAATKKEIASHSQSRLPERGRPQLCYGYLPGRRRGTPENYRDPSLYHYHSHSDYWSNSRPLQNASGQVLGYYKYVLVKQPGDWIGSWGKLFWLMIIGTAVWFWFFR